MKARNLKQQLTHILKKHHLVSVGELRTYLSKDGFDFNKTSIYRALDKLLEDGVICRHFFGGNEAVYELRKGSAAHAHVSCEKCGRVECLELQSVPQVKDKHKLSGFKVTHYHVTLKGICSTCR